MYTREYSDTRTRFLFFKVFKAFTTLRGLYITVRRSFNSLMCLTATIIAWASTVKMLVLGCRIWNPKRMVRRVCTAYQKVNGPHKRVSESLLWHFCYISGDQQHYSAWDPSFPKSMACLFSDWVQIIFTFQHALFGIRMYVLVLRAVYEHNCYQPQSLSQSDT